MRACLIRGIVTASWSGKFKVDRPSLLCDYLNSDNHGRYSCGLARQAITEFLRPEWHTTLEHHKDNPSAIGFTVEQMVISKIASAGVHSGDSIFLLRKSYYSRVAF
jgi:hypothetical protein